MRLSDIATYHEFRKKCCTWFDNSPGIESARYRHVAQAKTDVDEFIRRLKMYFNSPTLTREMCLSLFDHLVIGGKETVTGKPQEIHIYYKIDIDSVLSP